MGLLTDRQNPFLHPTVHMHVQGNKSYNTYWNSDLKFAGMSLYNET